MLERGVKACGPCVKGSRRRAREGSLAIEQLALGALQARLVLNEDHAWGWGLATDVAELTPGRDVELVGADDDQRLDLLGVQPDTCEAPRVALLDLLLAIEVLAERREDAERERPHGQGLPRWDLHAYDALMPAEPACELPGAAGVRGVIDEVGLGEVKELTAGQLHTPAARSAVVAPRQVSQQLIAADRDVGDLLRDRAQSLLTAHLMRGDA